MKRMLISFAVAGVMGLTACSQDSGSTTDGLAGSAESSQVAAKAQLRLSVKFPDSDRAQAALIDENASLIVVKVRRAAATTIEGLEEVFGICSSYFSRYLDDQYDPYYMDDFFDQMSDEDRMLCDLANPFDDKDWTVVSAVLDPQNSSVTLEVPVGEYEIYAAQYANEVDMNDDRRISGAKSYANLPEGQHSVSVTMTQGSWDFVDDLDNLTSLVLNLLNNADVLTDLGIAGFDFDPTTDGVVEGPGEVMGITDDLAGFHLMDNRYFKRMVNQPYGEYGGQDSEGGMDLDNILGELIPGIVSIPRITDGTIETDVMPRFEYATDGIEDHLNEIYVDSTYEFDIGAGVGFHLQQYDGTSNTNVLPFFDYWVETDNNETGEFVGAGLFFKAPFDFPSNAMSDGSNWTYDSGDDSGWEDVREQTYALPDGSTGSMWIAQAGTETSNLTHPADDPALTSFPDTMTSDGSTITGTLIEIVEYGVMTDATVVDNPTYDGAAPPESSSTLAQRATTAYRLEMAARDLGLKASAAAATTFGANCIELSDQIAWYFTEYMWDGTSWVPGTYNYSYYVSGGEVFGSDYDRDGIIEPFESVFNNNAYYDVEEVFTSDGNARQYTEHDANTNTFTTFYATTEHSCDLVGDDTVCTEDTGPIAITDGDYQVDTAMLNDPDMDGLIEQYEEAVVQENEDNRIHACIHDVTLKGRQLDIDLQTVNTEVVVN